MWATGCILAEMIQKEPIFQGKTEGDQLFSIFSILGSPTEREYDILSKKVPFDPKLFKEFPIFNRVSDDERFSKLCVNFKDKRNLVDLLGKLFAYLPEERISAKVALAHPFFNDIRLLYSQMRLH